MLRRAGRCWGCRSRRVIWPCRGRSAACRCYNRWIDITVRAWLREVDVSNLIWVICTCMRTHNDINFNWTPFGELDLSKYTMHSLCNILGTTLRVTGWKYTLQSWENHYLLIKFYVGTARFAGRSELCHSIVMNGKRFHSIHKVLQWISPNKIIWAHLCNVGVLAVNIAEGLCVKCYTKTFPTMLCNGILRNVQLKSYCYYNHWWVGLGIPNDALWDTPVHALFG